MSLTPLAIVGLGRMGRAVEELSAEHGFEVVARLGRAECAALSAGSLAGAAVAIEFSVPDAAPANIIALARAGCPVVSGTTGWRERSGEVEAAVRDAGGALLWSANFSLGATALQAIAGGAAALLGPAGFDAHLTETHHAAKRDAPSGTARVLVDAIRKVTGQSVPVTSIRTGHVPGTHEILFDGPYEQLRLEHVVRDRRVFAAGALRAARWIHGRRGIFHLHDVLGGAEDPG